MQTERKPQLRPSKLQSKSSSRKRRNKPKQQAKRKQRIKSLIRNLKKVLPTVKDIKSSRLKNFSLYRKTYRLILRAKRHILRAKGETVSRLCLSRAANFTPRFSMTQRRFQTRYLLRLRAKIHRRIANVFKRRLFLLLNLTKCSQNLPLLVMTL